MNHVIIVINFTVILGIVSGAPLLTCDKIKDVKQGKDNQDRYLVILKDPISYQDAEYVIGIVDLYQWSLEMNAFNAHDTSESVRSQLEPLENVGLQGILSKQALFLVSFHNIYNMHCCRDHDGCMVHKDILLLYIGVYR